MCVCVCVCVCVCEPQCGIEHSVAKTGGGGGGGGFSNQLSFSETTCLSTISSSQ